MCIRDRFHVRVAEELSQDESPEIGAVEDISAPGQETLSGEPARTGVGREPPQGQIWHHSDREERPHVLVGRVGGAVLLEPLEQCESHLDVEHAARLVVGALLSLHCTLDLAPQSCLLYTSRCV